MHPKTPLQPHHSLYDQFWQSFLILTPFSLLKVINSVLTIAKIGFKECTLVALLIPGPQYPILETRIKRS